MYAFAQLRNKKREISSVKVEFQGANKMFLTYEMVNNLLIQKLNNYSNSKKEPLDLNVLEKDLEQHPYVENAEVYFSENKQLTAKITQKSPIARVVNDGANYYIDQKGSRMALSNQFSARVLLVEGSLENKWKLGYVNLIKSIQKDNFLKQNIVGMRVLENDNVELITRNHNFKIVFGLPVLVDKKIKNYKAFYQYASKDSVLDSYKKINLVFTQQVVCSK